MKNSLHFILLLGLISCSGPLKRKPSSEAYNLINSESVEKLYKLNQRKSDLLTKIKKLELEISRDYKQESTSYTQNVNDLYNARAEIKSLNSEKINLENNIAISFEQTGENLPFSLPISYSNDWRVQEEKFIIFNPENFLLKNGKIIREFSMGMQDTSKYQLGLLHMPKIVDATNTNYNANFSCNGAIEVKKSLFFKKIEAGEKSVFELRGQKGRSPQILINMGKNVSECELLFSNIANPEKKYGIKFVSEKMKNYQITELRNKIDTCFLPDTKNLKGIEKFFLTNEFQSMTCVTNVDFLNLVTEEDPIAGLKAKAEALLGKPISSEMLNSKNPFLEMDFSKAPKLNTILISYLVFRADFYGNLIARLAKWHADQGAQVRILVSDVITLAKDHKMLYSLQESSNNIKLQEYIYDASGNGGGIGDKLSEFHRTMHVKLFITLGNDEKNNIVFFGGRNIHDGFVFKEVPDYSALPQLVQYGTGKGKDESFAHWRDFEVKITSRNLAESVAAHFLTLWERDSDRFTMRSINQNIDVKKDLDPK